MQLCLSLEHKKILNMISLNILTISIHVPFKLYSCIITNECEILFKQSTNIFVLRILRLQVFLCGFSKQITF